MLDYFNIYVDKLPAETLLTHPLLYESFTLLAGTNTHEIKGNVDLAEYKNLKFKVKYKEKIQIKGSMHKYMQRGTNHHDFSFNDMIASIKEFCSTFKINPNQAKLKSFEFGINLRLDAPKFIKAAVIHQTKTPNTDSYNGQGLSKHFEHQQYTYKLYDKAAESKSNVPILRIEFKIRKMIIIQKTNIKTFADLLDKNKFLKLKKYLTKPLQEMIFFEQIDTNVLSKRDAILCSNARDATYWNDLNNIDRETFKYNKKKFYKLLAKHKFNLQKTLIKKTEEKFDFLMSICTDSNFPEVLQCPQINQHFIIAHSPMFSYAL